MAKSNPAASGDPFFGNVIADLFVLLSFEKNCTSNVSFLFTSLAFAIIDVGFCVPVEGAFCDFFFFGSAPGLASPIFL